MALSDSNRNFNNSAGGGGGVGGGAARGGGVEVAERPLMQQRETNTRGTVGTVSFRNVANGGGGGSRSASAGRSSFRLAGGGILRHSSTPAPATKSHSSSFWRKHGGNPNLMDRWVANTLELN